MTGDPSQDESHLTGGAASTVISEKMTSLVKGAGFARIGGNMPLTNDDEIFSRASRAETALRKSVKTSMADPDSVRKSLNPSFLSEFGLFAAQHQPNGMDSLVKQLNQVLSTELGKNITLTSPLSSGILPYDLVAPSRLIYPVYSPFRNKVPRTQGQGSSRRAKVFTGIQGSGTPSGSNAVKRISISELNGGSMSNWPINLPAAGAQTAVDLNIPYQFFGLTEALSWLAQFAGQGFEDISALANLVLLQEVMLGEEYQMLWGTSSAIPTPAAATLAARTAGSNETAMTGVTTNVYVRVTAVTPYGETAANVANVAWSSGQVVDVTIAPSRGATQYNIYVGTGASDPGRTSTFFKAVVGGQKYTIQGAVPTTGANPPAADTGTNSATDYEGMFSILDGHAVTDASVYPSGFQAGYINKSVGNTLTTSVLNTALINMWQTWKANPAELVAEGSDVTRLANDIISSSSNSGAFRLMIDQGAEQAGARVGAAISEVQNPITRDVVRVVVHPWFTQGTALLLSYTLPMTYSNISNIWENVMVQDYLSVSWPVIDATFRYSLFYYGALVCYAPQYNGVLQGLQVSAATPYS